MLTNLGDGQLCSLVGICSESNMGKPAEYVETAVGAYGGEPSLECQFCEKVSRNFKLIITNIKIMSIYAT